MPKLAGLHRRELEDVALDAACLDPLKTAFAVIVTDAPVSGLVRVSVNV